MTQGFTNILANHFGAVPRRGLIALGAAAATTTIGDIVSLVSGDSVQAVDIAMLAVIVCAYLAASYICAMGMLNCRPSRASMIRYGTAQAMLWAPLIAAFALFALNPAGNRDATTSIGIILALFGLAAIMMLPAWPIGQAVAPPVPPFTLLKATKGHRFYLLGLFSIGGTVHGWIPDLDSVIGPLPIAGVLAGDFVVNVGTSLFYTALAVTSWQRASQKLPAYSPQTAP